MVPAKYGGVRHLRGTRGCDPLLLEGGGADACGCGPCSSAAESVRATGDEIVLRDANAVVCARAIEGAGEIHGNTRSAGGYVRCRSGKIEGEFSPSRTSRGASGEFVLLFAV